MNSYTFMGLDDLEEGEEVSSRKINLIKRAIEYFKSRRKYTRLSRVSITRDRVGAHERLVAAFFSENPMYNDQRFRQTFRMARPLFNRIVNTVTNHSTFFQNNPDCAGRDGISPLIKCTSAIRQLTYGVNARFLDEYMQLSEVSSRKSLDYFCEAVMEIYGPEYLRKPTVTDVEKLYRHHEAKHGFPGMLGSLDCSGSVVHTPSKLRSNNDINVLYQSPLFNDLKTGRAPEVPFLANGVSHPHGYYLVDGIYPELAPLVKTIPEPASDDHKRILYKRKQESARKDVERAFCVLKKKWAILANLTRTQSRERIMNMMYTCIILHNMIRKEKGVTISPRWFPEEAHQPNDLVRNEKQVQRVMRWIRSSQEHQNLRHDLIEHLPQNA